MQRNQHSTEFKEQALSKARHSDNGSPMKGETMLATMQRLGVAHSRSRATAKSMKSCCKRAQRSTNWPDRKTRFAGQARPAIGTSLMPFTSTLITLKPRSPKPLKKRFELKTSCDN